MKILDRIESHIRITYSSLLTVIPKILDRIERKIGDFDTTNELARKSNIESWRGLRTI